MKRPFLSPVIILGLVAAISTIAILTAALSRPWIGLQLVAEGDAVVVASVAPFREGEGVRVGDRVVALRAGDAAMNLRPEDVMEEPDGVATTAEMMEIFARSGRLNDLLATDAPEFVLDRDGAQRTVPARIQDFRPISDLPFVFWVQIFVGIFSMLVGGWLKTVRPREPASRWLLVSAVGLLASSQAAALYSTRELAMPETIFALASSANSAGALSFGLGMVCLFLTYPVRYAPRWFIMAVAVFFSGWALFSLLRLGATPSIMVHIPVLTLMIGILVAAGGQIWATQGNPSARAALRWFGLSVFVGAGGFVSLIAMPQAFGYAPQMNQGYAFATFLIVYFGMATGVARYRLFDLEFWALRALFYAGGVALLLLLDVLFVYAITMDAIPAFSLSLLIVAFVYLPARDVIGRVLTGRKIVTTTELIDLVADAALAPTSARQEEAIRRLLDELFHPMYIEGVAGQVPMPQLVENGEAMDFPGIEGVSDLRMYWAHRGRRLFSQRDLATARSVLQMAAQVVERRRAFEAGAAEERERIHRDMHDNIGAQLLGALHSGSETRKDALIRQTLTDLREIVSNPGGDPIQLNALLGDLRGELSEHLASAGIELTWETSPLPELVASPITAGSIRAILREGLSNIMRHSRATRAEVHVTTASLQGIDRLNISIRDDGRGLAAIGLESEGRRGTGLRNLAARLEARGGTFSVEPGGNGAGVEIRAQLPLVSASDTVVSLRDAGE